MFTKLHILDQFWQLIQTKKLYYSTGIKWGLLNMSIAGRIGRSALYGAMTGLTLGATFGTLAALSRPSYFGNIFFNSFAFSQPSLLDSPALDNKLGIDLGNRDIFGRSHYNQFSYNYLPLGPAFSLFC
jgi:hypothetical protein